MIQLEKPNRHIFNCLTLLLLSLTLTFTSCADFDTLVPMERIPGGTFTMGSDDPLDAGASPPHPVKVSGFYMSKFLVTQEQWLKVMGTTITDQQTLAGVGATDYGRSDNHPMYFVNWYEAVEFCNKLSQREGFKSVYTIAGTTVEANWSADGYRLPTEAEWEYACRAGTTTAYNTGDTIGDNTGWYTGNSGGSSHQVGTKPSNRWGLYDMHGNLFEWCWDWYTLDTSRVMRGGSWFSSADYLRSAYRGSGVPSSQSSFIGFRLVRRP